MQFQVQRILLLVLGLVLVNKGNGFFLIPTPDTTGSCNCGCIVLLPGFAEGGAVMLPLRTFIQEDFPCANVIILDTYLGFNTPGPVWQQVAAAKRFLEPYYKICPNITAIGHSQGSSVARGIIETTPNHNFTNLITIVSPNMGFSCVPLGSNFGTLGDWVLKNLTADEWCHAFLSDLAQATLGFTNYYRCYGKDKNGTDLFQLYLDHATFLPYVNNEINHGNNSMYKENFIRLRSIVSIGIPDDQVACPAAGSVWTTVENGVTKNMTEQEVYIDDTFGLRTVNERNPIVLIQADGYDHVTIVGDKTAYKNFIFPFLCK